EQLVDFLCDFHILLRWKSCNAIPRDKSRKVEVRYHVTYGVILCWYAGYGTTGTYHHIGVGKHGAGDRFLFDTYLYVFAILGYVEIGFVKPVFYGCDVRVA